MPPSALPRRSTAWVRRGAAMALSGLLAVISLTALSSCSRSAEDAATALDAALRNDDRDAVLALVSERSRPLVQAAWQLPGGATQPFRLQPGAAPLVVQDVQAQSGRMIAAVRVGTTKREWVFVQEGGAWRLDVFETALRRPWGP